MATRELQAAGAVSAPSPGRRPVVGFFGHDCTELTLIKRARAFQAASLDVKGFTFRRDKLNRGYRPEWDDVALGRTVDRHYGQRFWRLLQALPILVRERRSLQTCDFLYARNIDMAALALFGRLVAGRPVPLVYEVLDVQRVFTSAGLAGRLFRLAERWLLNRSDLLVVSSKAFVSEYFQPVQGFTGDWFLLENKVFGLDPAIQARRPTPETACTLACPPDGPWVIAWLGNLRCPRSPGLLRRIAELLGERVRIHIHGYPTETGPERFMELIGGQPNVVYRGEYRSPDDLQAIYDQAHFAWAFDYLDAGSNSRWLLPNRLYEGGFFGVPALADRTVETGRRVEELGLGWTVQEPVDEAVADLLRRLDRHRWLEQRRALLAIPAATFLDQGDTARLCRLVLSRAGERGTSLGRRRAAGLT